MNKEIAQIKKHIIKAVTIGWVLGCICILLPIGLAIVVIMSNIEGSIFDIGQLMVLLLLTIPQGFLIGIVVRAGLSLYQIVFRNNAEPDISLGL